MKNSLQFNDKTEKANNQTQTKKKNGYSNKSTSRPYGIVIWQRAEVSPSSHAVIVVSQIVARAKFMQAEVATSRALVNAADPVRLQKDNDKADQTAHAHEEPYQAE